MRKIFAVALMILASAVFFFRGGNEAEVRPHQIPTRSTARKVKRGASASAKAEIDRRPANAPQTKSEPSMIDEARMSIRTLNTCYESGCGLGEGDPKGPYFEIGKQIGEKLRVVTEYIETAQIVDESIASLARESLENSDGHVKEAALDLLATQPTSPANLRAILDGVIADSDPELIEQSLLELTRYDRGGDQEDVDRALRNSLLHGSPFVAQKIAEQIRTLLSARNYAFFSRLASEMEDESAIKATLLQALNSFER